MSITYATLMEAVRAAKKKGFDWSAASREWQRFFKRQEKMKTAEPSPIRRKPFPWITPGGYWWHSSKDPIRVTSGWHLTEFFKSPSRFGVTDAEIQDALLRWHKKETGRDFAGNPFAATPKEYADLIRKRVMEEEVDEIHEIFLLLVSKGWVHMRIDMSTKGAYVSGSKVAVRNALIELRDSGSPVMQGGSFGYQVWKDRSDSASSAGNFGITRIDKVIQSLR